MIAFLTARRGPLLFILLYVGGFLVFITQEAIDGGDAIRQQQSFRTELSTLRSRLAANSSTAKSRKAAGFVAASETQAIAGFDAFVRKTSAALGGVVVSSSSEAKNADSSANSIAVSAIIDGDIEVVQSTFYKLEMGSPTIFIDKVQIEPQNSQAPSNNPVLRVSMSLSSRWIASQ